MLHHLQLSQTHARSVIDNLKTDKDRGSCFANIHTIRFWVHFDWRLLLLNNLLHRTV